MITRTLRTALLGLLVVALASVGAWAQAGTASVFGTVMDQEGAVIPGAKITLTQVSTGAARTTQTNPEGRYEFAALPPGIYSLRVEFTGFRTAVRDRLDLNVDTATRMPVTLEVGAAEELVEVTAAAPSVNTVDAAMGIALSVQQTAELPLENRSIASLLGLQAGAIYLPGVTAWDPRSGSISGSRADQGNITLDGVDINDPQYNTGFDTALRLTQDALQEFKVTTSNYGAEHGRSSGAQVSLVTRGGTNELHGSAYYSQRNRVFSSNEFFNKLAQFNSGEDNEPPGLMKHLWGASLGGPIIKNRVFLFGNIENLREKRSSSVLRDIPSETLRDGILMYKCANAALCPAASVVGNSGTSYPVQAGYRGLTPAEVAALDPLNPIAAAEAAAGRAAVQNYFNLYPMPNDAGNNDGINFKGYRFAAPIENLFWTYLARADFHIDRSGNHKVFWRGSMQDDAVDTAPQFPGHPPNTSFVDNSKGMAVGYTVLLSSNLVADIRYGYTRLSRTQQGLLNDDLVYFRFTDPFEGDDPTSGRVAETHNIIENLSWVKGNHTFGFGTNIRFTRIPRFTNDISFHSAVANGSWNFQTGSRFLPGYCNHSDAAQQAFCQSLPAVDQADRANLGDSFTDILGIINQANAQYNFDRNRDPIPSGIPIERRFATNEYEFYFQDTWRMTPTLTLTYGVRYFLNSPVWETNGLQVAPTINTGEWLRQRGELAKAGRSTSEADLLVFDLAGPVNGKPHYYEYDKNNIAPRFSFAWTPQFEEGTFLHRMFGTGSVVRGGYGVAFDRVGHAIASQFDTVGSFGMATSLTSGSNQWNEDDPGIRFVDVHTIGANLRPPPPTQPFPIEYPLYGGAIEQGIDKNLRTPYVHMFNLSYARELPWSMAFESAYVGRLGKKLLTRRDLAMYANLVDPQSGMDLFTAANVLYEQVAAMGASPDYTAVTPVAYWENLFPEPNPGDYGGYTASQIFAEMFTTWTNATDVIYVADQFCYPACSILGPYAYFAPQYDSLGAVSSVGTSNYHSLQLSLRKRAGHGLTFDFNYALAKSLDLGSNIERGDAFSPWGNWGGGFLLNTWNPRQNYGYSDFDLRHSINTNWVWELPFGRQKWLGGDMHPALDAVVGGWSLSGIWRWNSGFPFNVGDGRRWATNWQLAVRAVPLEPNALPDPQTQINVEDLAGNPGAFADPVAAADFFRHARLGEVGPRSVLRGDGYFTIDLGIGKDWRMPYAEGHKLRLKWNIFNLTNTARFDVATINARLDQRNSFGRYNDTIGACDRSAGRCMEIGLRYEF